ncbi:phage holin family protein [Clostridium sp. LBM24168]
MSDTSDNKERSSSVTRYIIRLVITIIILAITSFLTPGFSIVGLWSYLAAAVVISVIDYLVEKFMGIDASPFGKGLKGFIIAAIILYLTQFIVPNMRVSIIGAIIAALIIGVLDAIMPSGVM